MATNEPGFTSPAPELVESWIAIDRQGRVIVTNGYIDMGTGIETAMRQIVADELDVPIEQVVTHLGDTALSPYTGGAQGSFGTFNAAETARIAAAETRQFLLERASDHLGVPQQALVAANGVISVEGHPDQQVSYGELAGGKRIPREVATTETWNGSVLRHSAPLKTPDQVRLVGSPVPRVDMPPKAFGHFEFVQDVRLPDMLHGRVVRPPSEGASLISVDDSALAALPGIVRVVREKDFLGVVTEREEQAIAAAKVLRAQWSRGPYLPVHDDRYDAVRNAPVVHSVVERDQGDATAALARSGQPLTARYEFPYQLHAMLGPPCAVADVRDGKATIWAGTQAPHPHRDALAAMLGLPAENVRIIWRQGSGSYGRGLMDDSIADAALLSRAVGRPVRVQWMREEEHLWEPVSPAVVMELRGALDEAGKIAVIDHQQWSACHYLSQIGQLLAWRHIGGEPGANPVFEGGFPEPHYEISNLRIARTVTEEIVRPTAYRAPGAFQSCFAFESFIDELAHLAGADPLAFRLRHLTDERATFVLQEAAKRAGWKERRAPHKRDGKCLRGRGIAFNDHHGAMVANVTDVEVDRETGAVRVVRVVVACDQGQIVNPDGLRNQYEGGTLQGISRTLMEEALYEDSVRISQTWETYPVLGFADLPALEIYPIDRPEIRFIGVGEAPVVPTVAAIANAVFDATGVRLRRVPFTQENVMQALRESDRAAD